MRGTFRALAAALALSALLSGCAREYGDTDEFRAFLRERDPAEAVSRRETAGEYTYVLEGGGLTFLDRDGAELWRSDPYWFVEEFRLFDVDGDGQTDCLFSLWKSYSFYRGYEGEDDPEVKNHLFLYTIRGGYGKALWASSNLPRRIHRFELSQGTPTPVATGAVLTTLEGAYEPSDTDRPREFTYTWQGWGFVPEEAPQETP